MDYTYTHCILLGLYNGDTCKASDLKFYLTINVSSDS